MSVLHDRAETKARPEAPLLEGVEFRCDTLGQDPCFAPVVQTRSDDTLVDSNLGFVRHRGGIEKLSLHPCEGSACAIQSREGRDVVVVVVCEGAA
jgi:hypothetical protein